MVLPQPGAVGNGGKLNLRFGEKAWRRAGCAMSAGDDGGFDMIWRPTFESTIQIRLYQREAKQTLGGRQADMACDGEAVGGEGRLELGGGVVVVRRGR